MSSYSESVPTLCPEFRSAHFSFCPLVSLGRQICDEGQMNQQALSEKNCSAYGTVETIVSSEVISWSLFYHCPLALNSLSCLLDFIPRAIFTHAFRLEIILPLTSVSRPKSGISPAVFDQTHRLNAGMSFIYIYYNLHLFTHLVNIYWAFLDSILFTTIKKIRKYTKIFLLSSLLSNEGPRQ